MIAAHHSAANASARIFPRRYIIAARNLEARNVTFPVLSDRRSARSSLVPPIARLADTSMPKPAYWNEATAALMRRDSVLRRLIRSYPGIHLKRRSDAFTALARAIVGQQISVKAADG